MNFFLGGDCEINSEQVCFYDNFSYSYGIPQL